METVVMSEDHSHDFSKRLQSSVIVLEDLVDPDDVPSSKSSSLFFSFSSYSALRVTGLQYYLPRQLALKASSIEILKHLGCG